MRAEKRHCNLAVNERDRELEQLQVGLQLETNLQLFQLTVALVYAQIALALWYAPVAAWVLLVSAWAKRVAILWAVLTPIAAMLFERVASVHASCRSMLAYRLRDGLKMAFEPRPRRGSPRAAAASTRRKSRRVFDGSTRLASSSNPWLWVGLVVAAGFVAAAIWMRRYREPI